MKIFFTSEFSAFRIVQQNANRAKERMERFYFTPTAKIISILIDFGNSWMSLNNQFNESKNHLNKRAISSCPISNIEITERNCETVNVCKISSVKIPAEDEHVLKSALLCKMNANPLIFHV